jgi:hypothetical protein
MLDMDTVRDVEKIDWMIEHYFDLVKNSSLDDVKLSGSKMLIDLMNLKFRYLGVEKEDNRSKMTEIEVRRRLQAAGVKLGGTNA